ncbi:hypothetical protein CEXT_460241 [Caerostris extrusa]|uniref:Uncharacterized protein n=1 Tax=Caerostris extrusa TaxID=172846 RepID=A0AAV4WG21_CAEEX|nr:hypothetical protein CEXT_460241 [Caerostris extrusa]
MCKQNTRQLSHVIFCATHGLYEPISYTGPHFLHSLRRLQKKKKKEKKKCRRTFTTCGEGGRDGAHARCAGPSTRINSPRRSLLNQRESQAVETSPDFLPGATGTVDCNFICHCRQKREDNLFANE